MATKIRVEVDSETVKALVLGHLRTLIGADFDERKVVIQVKSKQNYRVHDWETGDFRAVYEA